MEISLYYRRHVACSWRSVQYFCIKSSLVLLSCTNVSIAFSGIRRILINTIKAIKIHCSGIMDSEPAGPLEFPVQPDDALRVKEANLLQIG